MNLVYGVHFAAYLVIVGLMFRYIELRFPDSKVGRALAVIY